MIKMQPKPIKQVHRVRCGNSSTEIDCFKPRKNI